MLAVYIGNVGALWGRFVEELFDFAVGHFLIGGALPAEFAVPSEAEAR
jgi:hypothetical protein